MSSNINERTATALAFIFEVVRGNKAAEAALTHLAEHFAALTSTTSHDDAIEAAKFQRENDAKLAKWLRS